MKKPIVLLTTMALAIASCQKQENLIQESQTNHNTPVLYELVKENTYMMSDDIVGITSDSKYLWIMYRQEVGGYYDNDNLRLVKYDLDNHTEIASFNYQNYIPPSGLCFDGTNIWINYFATGGQTDLQKINISNGQILEHKSGSYNVRDIDFYENNIYMFGYNDSWNIGKYNINNGTINIIKTDFKGGLANRGISVRDNEIWTIDWSNKELVVNNLNGNKIGKVNFSYINDCDHCYEAGLHTTFHRNKFIITRNGEISIFNIIPMN